MAWTMQERQGLVLNKGRKVLKVLTDFVLSLYISKSGSTFLFGVHSLILFVRRPAGEDKTFVVADDELLGPARNSQAMRH